MVIMIFVRPSTVVYISFLNTGEFECFVLTTNDFIPDPLERQRYVGQEYNNRQKDIWLWGTKEMCKYLLYIVTHILKFQHALCIVSNVTFKYNLKFAYQLEKDERKDDSKEAHDGNLHDDFENVVLVICWIHWHLDVVIQKEGMAKSIQDNQSLLTQSKHMNKVDALWYQWPCLNVNEFALVMVLMVKCST